MPNEQFSCQALRVEQPIGTFWLAAIPADILLKVTVPDRLRILLDPEMQVQVGGREWKETMRLLGNQRPLEETRLRSVASYIDTLESTFPNSLILSANGPIGEDALDHPEDDTSLREKQDGKAWRLEQAGTGWQLVIPQNARPASVVDGQHRLYAFLRSSVEGRKDFELACSIFFAMPHAMQAMVFATINCNQKPVRRSLALNLYGYNVEDEPKDRWSPEKLAVFMARRLNFEKDSPLYMHIKIEAENAPEAQKLRGATRLVSMAAIVDGILKLISTNVQRDRDYLRSERFLSRRRRTDVPADGSCLREWYQRSQDKELYGLVKDYIGKVRNSFWEKAPDGSMLTRAVGIRALLYFLGDLVAEDKEVVTSTILRRAVETFRKAIVIEFSHSFFEATGRGQTRIQNVLRVSAGLLSIDDLPETDSDGYRDVLKPFRKGA